MRAAVFLIAIVFAFIGLPALAMDKPPAAAAVAVTEPLSIMTVDGKRHDFKVEVARDREAAAKGLMFRTEMPADHGMLFVFPGDVEAVRGFWMKNTLIPLDIVFIGKDGKIRNIGAGIPHNEVTVFSEGPIMHVVELNGGTAAKLGIRAGDVVHHAVFGNALEP